MNQGDAEPPFVLSAKQSKDERGRGEGTPFALSPSKAPA